MTDINKMRREYHDRKLNKDGMSACPFRQFESWFEQAVKIHEHEANAMAVGTVDKQGQPSSRMVLLKFFDETGFSFFTNYNSPKAQHIKHNDKVSLLFWWPKSERQVRIQGRAERLDAQYSDAYFASREKLSRIAAIASAQSQVLNNREQLQQRVDELLGQYPEDAKIPRPENWGGILVKPDYFEFWQGREHRLHDRFAYQHQSLTDSAWQILRLSP